VSSAHAAGSDTGGMFAAIDAKETEAFLGYLTEDAVFRFGSAPPVQGHAAIAAAVGGFFQSISGCQHVVEKTLAAGDTVICEGTVTYRRHDGSEITLPFTDVLEYVGDRIRHYKIYIDIAPLYTAA
jgi:limonene-1,2-epoxide hydrolase